jgi:hypothetical protein
MDVCYPKIKDFKKYSIRIDRMPYELTENERRKLASIFSAVMKNLAFYAKLSFIANLFSTEFLIRIYDKNNDVIGFGNATQRICGGVDVIHIMSIYVLPDFRGALVMNRSVKFLLTELAMENDFCLKKPLYFTASTVNAQVLYATANIYSLWPDLINNSPIPKEVRKIADGANEFYPVAGDRMFQVKITENFAGLKDGIGHDTKNSEFNRKFAEIADLNKFELVFFVGRIDSNALTKLLNKNPTNYKKAM